MKVSKLLVMALVVLAVITMSLSVRAGTNELKAYVNEAHTINELVFELTDSQKKVVSDYIATLDDATADSILADIKSAENIVKNSGVKDVVNLTVEQKKEIINLGQSAANKAGLVLTVDTANNTFSLTKRDGSALVSGAVAPLITKKTTVSGGNAGSTVGSVSTPAQNNGGSSAGSTLLYTGSNVAVYAVAVLAIVAVAVVVKKRA